MTWIIVVICVVVFLFAISGNSKENKKTTTIKLRKPELIIKMINRDGDFYEDEWHTYIAGLQHNVDRSDVGGFCGYIANQPDNPYDKKAVAEYSKLK